LSTEQTPSVLEMVQGPGSPRQYELFRPEIVIGRAIDADMHIASTDLSRRHVLIRRAPSGPHQIQDLESRNGVFVNGVKIHSATLHDGDSVQLGSILFVYHEGRATS
jgi:pSer/pThr/pTyr-binding forkhead associated (FHA) protein